MCSLRAKQRLCTLCSELAGGYSHAQLFFELHDSGSAGDALKAAIESQRGVVRSGPHYGLSTEYGFSPSGYLMRERASERERERERKKERDFTFQ